MEIDSWTFLQIQLMEYLRGRYIVKECPEIKQRLVKHWESKFKKPDFNFFEEM